MVTNTPHAQPTDTSPQSLPIPLISALHTPNTTDSLIPYMTHPFPSPTTIGTSTTVPLMTISPSHPMTTRAKDGIRKPNPRYVVLTDTNTLVEPSDFTQANKCPQWHRVMAKKFTALQRIGTWTLVPFQLHLNVLPNKLVYMIKCNSDGSIERFKAYLIANSFHQ